MKLLLMFGLLSTEFAFAKSVCGVFELNPYGQGCNGPTIYAHECPTIGLTIWRGSRGRSEDLSIVTDIPTSVGNSIRNLKCVCMDYHDAYSKFAGVTLYSKAADGGPRACGRGR